MGYMPHMGTPWTSWVTLTLVLMAVPAVTAGPVVFAVDSESEWVYLEKGTAIDAQLTEERSKGTISVEGSDLVNGMKISFRESCTNTNTFTYEDQDTPMEVYGVDTDPISFFYGKKGYITLHFNQTHSSYVGRKICKTNTSDALDHNFEDTGLRITVFEILSIADMEARPEEYVIQYEKIRAYKYSTVTYTVTGVGLNERLQFSLQYSCKNGGALVPIEGETPANLFDVNANGTEALVRFSRDQTDLVFASKDICVSRGATGSYDFSGYAGMKMTVFEDCIEQQCIDGSCHAPTGNCLCGDGVNWAVCASDNRNITSYINQSIVLNDPLMCRDIKWGHFEPTRALDQMYIINPTGIDRFPIWCDMLDGGWASIPATYIETQSLMGGQAPLWLSENLTYDLTLQRMEDIRNLSHYSKQEASIHCKSSYPDFTCPREPHHLLHESLWKEWNMERLWPVYEFDGCCFGCCYHTNHWRMSTAKFWSINLPIKNVRTYYGGADDNSEELRVEMQPVKFY